MDSRRIGRGLRLVLLGALVVAWSGHFSLSVAQVNVEGLRKKVAKSGLGAKLNVSVASYHGNTEGLVVGTSGLLGGASGSHMAYVNASGRYSRFGGSETVSRFGGHARYNYQALAWLAWEALAQLESDKYRRLKLRSLLGTGLRTRLLEEEGIAAFLGLTYLFEHNSLSADLQPVRPDVVHRLGTYLTATAELPSAGAVLSTTIYYQPRLGALSDFRILSVSSLDFKLASYLSAGIHAQYRHENPVLDGLKRGDLTLTNTLGVTF